MEILDVTTEDRDGLVHVGLVGELDPEVRRGWSYPNVAKVQEELRKVEQSAPATVVIDLSKLTFLDSTGLRCIVTADERAREAGRRMVVVRGPDAVQRVFSITRLVEECPFGVFVGNVSSAIHESIILSPTRTSKRDAPSFSSKYRTTTV